MFTNIVWNSFFPGQKSSSENSKKYFHNLWFIAVFYVSFYDFYVFNRNVRFICEEKNNDEAFPLFSSHHGQKVKSLIKLFGSAIANSERKLKQNFLQFPDGTSDYKAHKTPQTVPRFIT